MFPDLVRRARPGKYETKRVREALRRTINITATDGGRLEGCVRVLTVGYPFGTIPEILVDPAYQVRGIRRRLMELA